MPGFLKSREALVGLAMIVIGLGFLAAAFRIEILSEGIAPRVFPMAGAVLIAILGGIQIAGASADSKPPGSGKGPHILGLLTLSFAYVIAITHLGYLVSTAVAAPVVLWLFGIRSKPALALSVILCPAIYHLIFFEGLDVFPPYGSWFDLLDVIQGY